jgi:hypothetical protein
VVIFIGIVKSRKTHGAAQGVSMGNVYNTLVGKCFKMAVGTTEEMEHIMMKTCVT